MSVSSSSNSYDYYDPSICPMDSSEPEAKLGSSEACERARLAVGRLTELVIKTLQGMKVDISTTESYYLMEGKQKKDILMEDLVKVRVLFFKVLQKPPLDIILPASDPQVIADLTACRIYYSISSNTNPALVYFHPEISFPPSSCTLL
ncbi:MAG: hypothetical protein WCP39_00555 [Chlamydiota bacterium]